MKNALKKSLVPILISSSLLGCQKEEVIRETPKENVVSEKVVEMKKDDFKDVLEIDENSILFEDASKYRKGDILVSGISEKTPNGLIRKIESIEDGKAKTSLASLDEAIIKGNISFQKDFTKEDLIETHKSTNSNFEFSKSFDEVIFDLDENLNTTDDQVRVYGNFYFNCKQEADVDFDNGVTNASFLFSIDGELDMGIKGELYYDFEKRKEIASLDFKPFMIPGAPIPIVCKPELDLLLDVEGFVDGNFDFSINSDVNFSCEPSYSSYSGWDFVTNKNIDLDFNTPKASLEAYCKASIGPRATLTLNAFVGPFMELRSYVEADVNINENPWWEFSTGLEANLGMDCGVLSKWIPEINKTIYKKEGKTFSSDSVSMPNAILESDKTLGNAPLSIFFDGTKSNSGSEIEKYIFYTDGEKFENNTGLFEYEYNKPSNYWAKLEVVDKIGRRDRDSLEVLVNSPYYELSSDDGSFEDDWASSGYCEAQYYSEASTIEKHFDLPAKPFYLDEVKIMFHKKATNNSKYVVQIYDGEEFEKSFTINYEKPFLDQWYTQYFESPIKIENSLTIYGYDFNEPANCGNPDIHGWGVCVDKDNSGDSFRRISRITNDFYYSIDRKKIDGEFLIRANGHLGEK